MMLKASEPGGLLTRIVRIEKTTCHSADVQSTAGSVAGQATAHNMIGPVI
jgi:hypothetical protein